MNKLNFLGKLVFFDYQKDNCTLDDEDLFQINRNIVLSRQFKSFKTYYKTTLSFRDNLNVNKSLNSTEYPTKSPSLLSNNTNLTVNLCHNKMNTNEKFFSHSYLNSQLPRLIRMNSYSLFDGLNLIIRLSSLNILDCKTHRLKPVKRKFTLCNFPYVNIFLTQKSPFNDFRKQIQLIGQYSSINDEYQSCYMEKPKDSTVQKKKLSSKIYYITSVFDEPFLMLRKRTPLYKKYSPPHANVKELLGRVLDFDQAEGFCVDLAEKVCSILNITCQFRIVEDGRFGSKNKTTGIWDGK